MDKLIMTDSTGIGEVHTLTIYPDYYRAFVRGYMTAWTPEACPVYQDLVLEANIAPLLATITILDLQEAGAVRYRFCGSGIVDHTGMDLTGLDLLDLVPAEGKDGLYTDMKSMLSQPCGNFSQHLDVYHSGKSVNSESLSLPLRSRPDEPEDLLITLHASEWTVLPDAQRTAMLADNDVRVGADWIQSLFVDIGHGTPGPTALYRDQSDI